MAYWSHTRAGPPNDPGYLEWENFRTEEELKDLEDKKKQPCISDSIDLFLYPIQLEKNRVDALINCSK